MTHFYEGEIKIKNLKYWIGDNKLSNYQPSKVMNQ